MGVLLTDSNGKDASRSGPARTQSNRVYRFGVFELGAETGELWKHGTRIKLQIKPFQILTALLERPGELITREELRNRLWPAGTFVDFESGLNTATNRLRAALGDSAESPRYIETLPRLGYRFICPVTESERRRSTSILLSKAKDQESRKDLETAITDQPAVPPSPAAAPVPTRSSLLRLRRFRSPAAILLIAVSLAFTTGYVYFKDRSSHQQPVFRELTFRTGKVGPARFTGDSRNAVFSAKWVNGDQGIYFESLQNNEARRLGIEHGRLTAVSRSGNLAIANFGGRWTEQQEQLSRVPLLGGSAQVIADGAMAADWAPNEHEMALVREHGSDSVVEFPAGHPVYTSHGWIDCLRVSPRGDEVAFLEHPVRDDSAGYLRLADRAGRSRTLTAEWASAEGLAWAPSGREVWFTASKSGSRGVLYAVSESGRLRQVSDSPSSLRLLDMSTTGRVLLATDDTRETLWAAFEGEKSATDLSKFDATHVEDISSDGNLVLFTEGGEAGGRHYATYVYDHRSRSTFPIGDGRGLAISQDERWVLTIDPRDRGRLTIKSIGGPDSKRVFGDGFTYQWAKFLPGGEELLVGGAYPGQPLAMCKQKIADGKPIPIEGVPYLDYLVLSPDGKRVAGENSDSRMVGLDIETKRPLALKPESARFPVAWSKDSDYLYVVARCDSTYLIKKINVANGVAEPWKAISNSEEVAPQGLASVVVAPEAGAYAYSSEISFSRLYLVDGWS